MRYLRNKFETKVGELDTLMRLLYMAKYIKNRHMFLTLFYKDAKDDNNLHTFDVFLYCTSAWILVIKENIGNILQF